MFRIQNYTLLPLILLLLFLTPQLVVSVEPPDVTYLSSLSGGLHTPIRIATDAVGRAYVTDTRGHRVCILDASGKLRGYIYGIETPLGIAVDSKGRIYIGDKQTGSVAIFTANSDIPIGKLGIGDGQFAMPTDIAIDSQDKIYVVDSKENCVKVFDKKGDYEFQFGDSILTFPTGVAIDETNDAILVGQYGALEADKNAAAVQIFDLKGNWQNSIGRYGSGAGEFTRIQGIAVDSRGRIYVADCFQSTVQVVDYDGIGLSFIGSYGTNPGELRVPSDVALDRYNRLWVTSSNNRRIEVFGIDEYSLPGNKRPTGSKSGFKMNLSAGVNLVSAPLKPPTEWRLSDLAAHIGDEVMSITTYAPDKKQFLSYLPSFAENKSANVPVKGNVASIIVMKEGKEVEFQGTVWEGEVEFTSGLNMFAVPRKPTVEWQLSDLAQHIGKELVYLITYNRNSGRFESYFPEADSLSRAPLEEGAGYFASMSKSKTVVFEGGEWRNQPLTAAPLIVDKANISLSEVPLLVVTGEVLNTETGKRLKNSNIEIKNLGTGIARTAMTNSDGSYVLTFVDFPGNRAGKVGDVLQVKAMDPSGQWISQTTIYTLTAEDIRRYHVTIPTIQLEIIPQKSVLLPSYPNPSNPETWIPFRLSRDTEVKIEIYNVVGQLVRTLNLGRKAAGNYISRQHAAHWDGTNDTGESVTSGLYFYTIRAGAFKSTRRMVILK